MGFLSCFLGQDYHLVLRDRLQKLETYLIEKLPDIEVKSMVDTGELSDRAVSERAGIGWSGKTALLLHLNLVRTYT